MHLCNIHDVYLHSPLDCIICIIARESVIRYVSFTFILTRLIKILVSFEMELGIISLISTINLELMFVDAKSKQTIYITLSCRVIKVSKGMPLVMTGL